MKYVCNTCKSFFNLTKIDSPSLLVKYTWTIICPYCGSKDIKMTDIAKLQIDRKQKISKIENESKRIN